MQTIKDALAAVSDATPSVVEELLSRLHCDGTEDARGTLLALTEEQMDNMQLSFVQKLTIKCAQSEYAWLCGPGGH